MKAIFTLIGAAVLIYIGVAAISPPQNEFSSRTSAASRPAVRVQAITDAATVQELLDAYAASRELATYVRVCDDGWLSSAEEVAFAEARLRGDERRLRESNVAESDWPAITRDVRFVEAMFPSQGFFQKAEFCRDLSRSIALMRFADSESLREDAQASSGSGKR